MAFIPRELPFPAVLCYASNGWRWDIGLEMGLGLVLGGSLAIEVCMHGCMHGWMNSIMQYIWSDRVGFLGDGCHYSQLVLV